MSEERRWWIVRNRLRVALATALALGIIGGAGAAIANAASGSSSSSSSKQSQSTQSQSNQSSSNQSRNVSGNCPNM